MNADSGIHLVDVPTAASTLGLSQRGVRHAIAVGTLPVVRVGRRVLVRSTDLERAITAGLERPGRHSRAVPIRKLGSPALAADRPTVGVDAGAPHQENRRLVSAQDVGSSHRGSGKHATT